MKTLAKTSKEFYKRTSDVEYIAAGLLVAAAITFRKYRENITPEGVKRCMLDILQESEVSEDEVDFQAFKEIFK